MKRAKKDVMVTDKEISALKELHHQLLKLPPRLDVTTSSVIPKACVAKGSVLGKGLDY